MRILRVIQEHPVTLLSVMVGGLIVWVGADLLTSGPRRPQPRAQAPPTVVLDPAAIDPRVAPGPRPTAAIAADTPEPVRHPSVSAAQIPKLKPGMTRVEVEGILGPPPPEYVQPVVVSEGRLSYRTAYEVIDPDRPGTIRPIPSHRTPADPKPTGTPLVTLEYDATRTGHPLVEVRYLDPAS
jgi:hypothetical protein